MRSRSTHKFVGVSAALLTTLALLTAAARAQDRLIVAGQEVGTYGRFGQKLGDAPPWIRRSAAGDPEWIAGGRYVMTVEYTSTRVTETLTGREISLPVAARVVADPIRPRVFVLDGTDVRALDLDTGTTTVLATARSVPLPVPGLPPLVPLPEAQFAQNAGQLFVRRANEARTAWEVVVLDVATGALVRTLPDFNPASFGAAWIVVPDGTRLFAIGGGDFVIGILGARAIDAVTGAVVATAPASGELRWDDVFQRLYVVGNLTGALKAFDRQLTPLGQTDGGYCFSNVRVSPHTGRLYHLRAAGGGGSYYGAIDTRLEVFGSNTGERLADESVTAALGLGWDRPVCGDYTMLLATAPGAPRNLAGSVTAHDVTLSWTNVGDASGFVLDVGFWPGRTDLSTFVGGATTATFTNVPSGTYYLRVRGGNAFGGGRPSNEVVVTVP